MHFWVAAAASDARAAIYSGAASALPIMIRGGPNSTAACTLYGRWIAVAQASQLPQVVPQDVARPFASLGLPQVVP